MGQRNKKRKKERGFPPFRLSFEDPEQLTAALSYPGLSRFADEIAIDSTGFPADSWQNAVVQVHQAALSCMLILPCIFRTEAVRYFEKHLDTFRMAGFDGTVVRSMEEVQWLKEKGIPALRWSLTIPVYLEPRSCCGYEGHGSSSDYHAS